MRSVAVIEDDPGERLVLKGLIEECGYGVVALGACGADAVEIAGNKRPDVVIMDIRMPGRMDGVAAAAAIAPICPVVLITALDDDGTINRAVEAGVMAYIFKPVRLEDITPAVELAVTRFKELKSLGREVSELKGALEGRKLVERAKGLIMERERLTENEAFARLRRISMDRRCSLSEVARIIIGAMEVKTR